MKFKTQRTTVTQVTDTPEGIWAFLESSRCSTVTARLPYLGELLFRWSEKEEYSGDHPTDVFRRKKVHPKGEKICLTGGLVVVSASSGRRGLWLPCTSAKELVRLLNGALKAAERAALGD